MCQALFNACYIYNSHNVKMVLLLSLFIDVETEAQRLSNCPGHAARMWYMRNYTFNHVNLLLKPFQGSHRLRKGGLCSMMAYKPSQGLTPQFPLVAVH